MLRRFVIVAGLAFALAGVMPLADAAAQQTQEAGFWKRRPFPGFGMTVPGAKREPFFRRRITLPNYFFENRTGFFAARRPVGHSDLANALRARGFKDVGTIQQRGSTYITEATGPGGERVRLVINGVTGGIDGVRVIGKGG